VVHRGWYDVGGSLKSGFKPKDDRMDFNKPRSHYAHAVRRLGHLKKAKTFEEYEEIYLEIVGDFQLIFNKVSSLLKNHPKESSLLSKYRHDRSADELLSYLKVTRDSEEHSIADVTKKEPGFVGVRGAKPGSLYIESLSIRSEPDGKGGTKVTVRQDGGDPLRVIVSQPKITPLPVKERGGKVYHPPKTHLGLDIQGKPLHEWLELAVAYYGAMLAELESKA
jgi:hypothetical protein